MYEAFYSNFIINRIISYILFNFDFGHFIKSAEISLTILSKLSFLRVKSSTGERLNTLHLLSIVSDSNNNRALIKAEEVDYYHNSKNFTIESEEGKVIDREIDMMKSDKFKDDKFRQKQFVTFRCIIVIRFYT